MSTLNNVPSRRAFEKVSTWIKSDQGINTDLIQGTKDFAEAKRMREVANNENDTEKRKKIEQEALSLATNAYNACGIKIIRDIILSELTKAVNGLNGSLPGNLGNIFVEYSLVASTLDPVSRGKLQCCSFVTGGNYGTESDEYFKERIGKYYAAAIDKIDDDEHLSIYQHPDFLYNIGEKKYTITMCNKESIDEKIDERSSEFFKIEINDKSDQNGGIYFNTFRLERIYSEMIKKAQEEFEKKSMSLEDLQKKLHQLLYNKISFVNNNRPKTFYISFPIYGSIASNQLPKYKVGTGNPLQGIGACFIYFESKYEQLDEEYLDDAVSTIADQVGNVIRFMSANYLFNLGLQLQEAARKESERAKKESVKSAKAAIMSRNMSHNLGSHVMAYLKHHLSSVKDMLNDKILSQIFDNEEELKEFLETPSQYSPKLRERINKWSKSTEIVTTQSIENEDILSNVALPFLVGLGQFISYLQERQDFIATIATSYIPYFSSVNFKDFIYDELNNDKRYERHPDRQNLKPDNILLGNIARSEGLGRTTSPTKTMEEETSLHDIVLKFRTTFNGNPVEEIKKPYVNPLNYYSAQTLEIAREELDEMRSYDVSLPGGVVGRQAVFSIIENIIRNAAKHGNWRDKGKLELTIDIFTKEDIQNENSSELLRERLRDDRSTKDALSLKEVLSKFYCRTPEMGNGLYFVTITDNLTISMKGGDVTRGIVPTSLSSLRKALIEDYIDGQSGQMKNSNKGIKEMRISATWLRAMEEHKRNFLFDEETSNIEDGKWEVKNTEPPVLYARISKDKDGDCHLQYIFCLVRPQKVALISNGFTNVNNNTEKILRKHSWHFFTPNSFLRYKNKSFDIIVYDKASSDDAEYNEVKSKSPFKFIFIDDHSDKKILNFINLLKNNSEIKEIDLPDIEKLLYRELSCWDGKEKILISDDRAKNHYEQDPHKDNGIGDKITFSSNDELARYRYLTHLEDREKFEAHIINDSVYASRFYSSEGITGNNSTDRLIRNEKLTEIWFYRHLFAMKQKVAIFDERIFSKVFGLEEADLSQDIFSKPEYSKYRKFEEENKKLFLEKNNLKRLSDKDVVDTKNYIGATYAHKNVFIFSIIRSNENEKEFNLYGYHKKAGNRATFSECKRYATISWQTDNMQNKLKITPCCSDDEQKSFLHGFNAISIHQGLLDKLYGQFGIKNMDQERENLTKDFYSYFSNPQSVISFKDNEKENLLHHFLPGMTIHSGRSKPSESDMPQHIPFIPFSAIENAVFDCKYSLTELLYSARYE